jgi:histidinol-phosphatase
MIDDLAFAHRLADAADVISLRRPLGRRDDVHTKADGSLVTDTDAEVERHLLALVSAECPEDGFLGEEVGQARHGVRRWIVDGVDGTAAFVASRPEWSTLIALEDHGRLLIGVVSSPALGRRWWASADEGAWSRRGAATHIDDGEALRVSRQASLASASIGIWPPAARLTGARRTAAERLGSMRGSRTLARTDNDGRDVRPSWGTGYPNAALVVAAGVLDAVVLFGGGPWDHAATSVIVEAAGGAASDLSGHRRIDTGGAVFSNGPLHQRLVDVIDVPAGG